jgi:hypothetical protein
MTNEIQFIVPPELYVDFINERIMLHNMLNRTLNVANDNDAMVTAFMAHDQALHDSMKYAKLRIDRSVLLGLLEWRCQDDPTDT